MPEHYIIHEENKTKDKYRYVKVEEIDLKTGNKSIYYQIQKKNIFGKWIDYTTGSAKVSFTTYKFEDIERAMMVTQCLNGKRERKEIKEIYYND